MATQLDFLAALAMGIGPALLLVWFSLRRFDRPRVEATLFDDRRVFGFLAVGMIFGVFASVLARAMPRFDLASSVLAVGASFLVEELFKVVALNRKGYQGRFDTTFTGVSLGAGLAATTAMATIYWNVTGSLGVPDLFVTFLLFSVTMNLVHVDTGVLIGFGAARKEMGRPLGKALAIRGAHAGFLFPLLVGAPNPWSLVAASTSTGFALLVFYYAYAVLLPATLPQDLQRKARRERRRAPSVKD